MALTMIDKIPLQVYMTFSIKTPLANDGYLRVFLIMQSKWNRVAHEHKVEGGKRKLPIRQTYNAQEGHVVQIKQLDKKVFLC